MLYSFRIFIKNCTIVRRSYVDFLLKIVFYRYIVEFLGIILYCSQLTEESLVVLKQTLKTSYTQRSSTKTFDSSLFHLLIADGIQSFDVKHMYM